MQISNIFYLTAYNITKGVDIMCIIKNGNEEGLSYEDGMVFEVREHYYEGKLIAYNLYLENELIESYDEAEIAICAMKALLKEIVKNKAFIDIEKINMLIEA